MSFFKNPFKKELTEEQVKNQELGEKLVEGMAGGKGFTNITYTQGKKNCFVSMGVVDVEGGTTCAFLYLVDGKLNSITFHYGFKEEKYNSFKEEYTETPERIIELLYHVYIDFRSKFDCHTEKVIKTILSNSTYELLYIYQNYKENKTRPLVDFLIVDSNSTSSIPSGKSLVSVNPLD